MWSVSIYILKKVKKIWISHCIFNSCAKTFRFFQSRKLIFGQMACIYLLNSQRSPNFFYFEIKYFISNYSYHLVKDVRITSYWPEKSISDNNNKTLLIVFKIDCDFLQEQFNLENYLSFILFWSSKALYIPLFHIFQELCYWARRPC